MARDLGHLQEPLFENDPNIDAENAAREARRRRQIVEAIDAAIGPGPTLAAVRDYVQTLTDAGTLDAAAAGARIATALAAARAVDKATGHNLTGWYANGRDASPLLEQLRAAIADLEPDAGADPFDIWLNDDDAPREDPAHVRSNAPPPHTA